MSLSLSQQNAVTQLSNNLTYQIMRNVYFKMWIPIEYADGGNGNKTKVPDTGCWQKDFKNKGVFHQWASAYESFGENAANYTVALVELSDGTIVEVLPGNIKFIN